MDWIPLVFVTFKLAVFGTGMFFAIKWHYDKQENAKDRRAVLVATGKVAAGFLLGLLGLGLFTWFIVTRLGLDMTLP